MARLKELRFAAEVLVHGGGLELTAHGRIRPARPGAGEMAPAELEVEEGGPSPETLLAMAHVFCYASSLSSVLEHAGEATDHLRVRTEVTLTPGEDRYLVTGVRAEVTPAHDMDPERLRELAHEAEKYCPVSGALANQVPMTVEALPAAPDGPPHHHDP